MPIVWAIALVAVAVRLPLLGRTPSPDEAGFLLVGGQWHPGGTSLYGTYWVDRPPLLITLFRIAAEAGGLVPLRLIGCVAVALTILGVAHVARSLAGPRAVTWAALAAGTLLVTPLTGSMAVNGELLATPFVVWGIAAMVGALRHGRHPALLAAAAGAAMVGAVLVKQNFIDVGVFTAAVVPLALWRRELTVHQARNLLADFVLGAAGALAVMSVWTLLQGTSLAGVYDAMFPFRFQAERVLASAANHGSRARLPGLLFAWLVSGGAVLMLLAAWAVVRRRLGGVVVWALVVTASYEVVSVLLGGSYWSHYLVQLVVPLSLLVGLAAARAFPGARSVVVAAATVAVLAWAIALPWQQHRSLPEAVGTSIAAVASPQDTIVTLYGHAEVTRASGLSSPYPYLWSLPTKTRDPDLHLLSDTLSGPAAPTWFVTWNRISTWGVNSTTAASLLATRYHPVAHPHGHTIYLLNGVHRKAPVLTGHVPPNPPRLTTVLKGLLR